MSEIILGVKGPEAIITPVCRANRGIQGAWDEAARRLRTEYLAVAERYSPFATFRLVLFVEHPPKPFADMESADLPTDEPALEAGL